jgi:hypothetical protein
VSKQSFLSLSFAVICVSSYVSYPIRQLYFVFLNMDVIVVRGSLFYFV